MVEDFVIEPYRRPEMLFRVGRVISSAAGTGSTTVISRGALTIDDESFEVRVGKRKVDLTYLEYRVLKLLALHPGRVVSRETIRSRIWGADHYGGYRTIDVHIRRLRSKLDDAEHSYIDTVRSVGYRFKKVEVRAA
jgi:two-component system alkaline phosphatase synthesis response regulator PhoP